MPNSSSEFGVPRAGSTQPRATALDEVVLLLGGATFPRCESPSLRLERFVRVGGTVKKDEITCVVACHGQHAQPIPALVPPGAATFTAGLGARLIVNQAGGVLENAGLCLHRHYGNPYIPGSAVKGVARHAAWCAWNEEPDTDKKRQIAKMFVRVFGYPTGDKALNAYIEPDEKKRVASAGGIAFLAAVPDGRVGLAVDIVNCHHPDYYSGKQDDAYDNESPNPQFFPVVESGAEFRFTLVPLGRLGEERSVCLEQAQKWLLVALTLHGVGAKTAAGYGWFAYDEAAEQRRQQLAEEREARRLAEETRRAEAEKRRIEKEEQREKLAAMSPAEQADAEVADWNDDALQARLDKFHIARKGPSEELKAAIVRALRNDRLNVWSAFKQKATKGEPAKAADAVRKASKDLGLGKMP